MLLRNLGEFGLIDMIRKTAARNAGVICGIGDDTAVLEYNSREYLLFTTDMMVEGVHFEKAVGPPRHSGARSRQFAAGGLADGRRVGHKALACNISDIAAMGGTPTFAVVSLGASPKTDVRFIKDLYQGMSALARKFGIAIVGGDTVKNDKLVINIALLGKVAKNKVVTRASAKIGDVIFVTGRLGDSLATGRHLSFTPRIAESQFLTRQFQPTAMIDISDGLAADLGHILEESKVGATLFSEAIPRTPGATLDNALYDGEDFELVFTLPAALAQKLLSVKTKFSFYPIGQITPASQGLRLRTSEGQTIKIKAKGFRHF